MPSPCPNIASSPLSSSSGCASVCRKVPVLASGAQQPIERRGVGPFADRRDAELSR
jgi:hypothetical protein